MNVNKQKLAILIVAALGVIATFLPWAGVFGLTVNGLHLGSKSFFGYANLVLYAVPIVLCLLGDMSQPLEGTNRTIAMACAILAGVLVLFIAFRPFYGGLGTWLAFLAAIALPIVAVKVKDKK